MNYKLSQDDMREIKATVSGGFAEFNKFMERRFKVGDILIKKEVDFDGDDRKETIEKYPHSNVPKRYLVIHTDEATGFAFCKEILETGKIDKRDEAIFIQDFNLVYPESLTLYEVDPLFVDSVLFGDDFDIGHILKEEQQRKQRVVELRKQNAKIFNNLKAINSFLSSLKIGSTLWMHFDDEFDTNHIIELTLKNKRKQSTKNIGTIDEIAHKYGLYKKQINDDYVIRISSTNLVTKRNRTYNSLDLIGAAIYVSKPTDLKEDI